MKESAKEGRIICPHTAVGLNVLNTIKKDGSENQVLVSTAHPAKFLDILNNLGLSIELPESLKEALAKPHVIRSIGPDLASLEEVLRDW